MDLNWLRIYDQLLRIGDDLGAILHPNLILKQILEDSIGVFLNIWSGFILTTTDMPGPGDFVGNATIQRFEPAVQAIADMALVLVVSWAAYRIMWGHGLFTQYTARIMLPRVVLAVVLINFSLPLIQMCIDAANTVSSTMFALNTYDDVASFYKDFDHNPNAVAWEVMTTFALGGGYGVLAVAYLMRFAILILLAITAPLAALLFMLPETHHLSKSWMSNFMTNLAMQPAQLFVLSVGFGLEKSGFNPMRHLFALAALLIAFKVPGAFGASEKVAHKLEHILLDGFKHMGHALAKA